MISLVIISKDEAGIDDTLADAEGQVSSLAEDCEIIVVDASSGRLDHIKRNHEATVRWLDFTQPAGVRVSIPHQRNAGVQAARGDIIVFTDAGCRLKLGWLARLVEPLSQDENVVIGAWKDASGDGLFEGFKAVHYEDAPGRIYLSEGPTLNFAFRRAVFDQLGGFDENLAYGSDVDFCWRLTDAGYRVRYAPEAIVENDWGTSKRQRRRSYIYGKARARLYRKHRSRRKNILRTDPVVIINPLLLLGLPIALVFPFYLLMLLVPARWGRYSGSWGVIRAVPDQLWFGAGVLAELLTERVYAGQNAFPTREFSEVTGASR